jgi:hypothetical protein
LSFLLSCRFIYVPAPHTGEVICDELYEALVEWNLDEKISTVTLDNCTTNDAVISNLIKKIGETKLLLEGKLLHMRCVAHILNLIVKDGLEVIQPITKIHDSIAFWTATPKRIEKFEEIAKYVRVPIEHKLALDCKTSWNSTYKMLTVALPYEAVFNRATCVEKLYNCAPTKDEWDFAKGVVQRLKMFNDITTIFSGTNYVTVNIDLLKICEAKMKIKEWFACGNPIIEQMPAKMIEKFDWKDIHGTMGVATILDPRFKIDYLLGFFETLFCDTTEVCMDKVHAVRNSLYELMREYQVKEYQDNTKSSALPLENFGFLSSISACVAIRRPTIITTNCELHRYLKDELIPIEIENS